MKRKMISIIIIIFILSIAPFSGRTGSPEGNLFQIETPLQDLAVNPATDLYTVSRSFQPVVQLGSPGMEEKELLFASGKEDGGGAGGSKSRVGISDGGWILALGCIVYGIVMRRRRGRPLHPPETACSADGSYSA
jgi:hypothetical protein